jgi:hypothetical protein
MTGRWYSLQIPILHRHLCFEAVPHCKYYEGTLQFDVWVWDLQLLGVVFSPSLEVDLANPTLQDQHL